MNEKEPLTELVALLHEEELLRLRKRAEKRNLPGLVNFLSQEIKLRKKQDGSQHHEN